MARDFDERSLLRRLAFATGAKFFVETLYSKPPIRSLIGAIDPKMWHPMPEFAARTIFDLIESVRTGQMVPNVGKPHMAVLGLTPPVRQDPRYRGYWYDPEIHALVGMHLGIDLIRNGGKYYVLESNLSAAIRDLRRALYQEPLDPLVSGLATLAKQHGFTTLVVFARQWPDWYLEEFKHAEREIGVEIRPTCSPHRQPDGPFHMIALPPELAPNTMYVMFPSRGLAMDQFIADKTVAGVWLQQAIEQHGKPDGKVAAIPSYDRLTVPPLDEAAPWPNLVVKLTPSTQGRNVATGRFRSEAEARAALGLTGPDARPSGFKLKWQNRIANAIFRTRQVVYQPFVPPEVDADGHPSILRLHIFVSPLFQKFLSVHKVIAAERVPEALPFGLVENDRTFVVNYERGARYARLSTDGERETEAVADEFGRLLDSAVRKRFETGPGGSRAT